MKKILAIDDQQDNLLTIKALIKNFIPGCQTLTARSGKEGLEIAEKEQPDTILLDIIMPGMDGFEVCKKLKANESTRHIPVIMLTAIRTDIESRVKGLDTGADAFCSKPIDPLELFAQVNVMLRIKEAEDKLRAEMELLDEKVKERTKELRESEGKLRNIFENSTNLFYSHTPDHIITYLSPQVKDILGYTQEEVMIKWTELTSDNPINEIGFKHTVKAIETGKRQPTYELELVKKNGEKIWVEVREAPVVKDGKTVSIVGALTDITERLSAEQAGKKAEKMLQESERRYHNLLENANDLIQEIEPNGKILYVNKQWLEVLEYSKEEVKDMRVTDILREDQIAHTMVSLQGVAKGEKVVGFRTIFMTKNGKEIYVEGNGNGIFEDNKFISAMGIFRDITDRRKAEKELKKKMSQLELFNKVAVDRELKMVELKKEVDDLLEKAGLEKKYTITGLRKAASEKHWARGV